ncbi:helix-turn-helix domain-containing protein [Luteimonas sp. A537]
MSSLEQAATNVEASLRAFGARVAQLRLSRNMTQASLSRESGASVSSIKRLEAGGNTSLDTLLRVLGALGLGDRLLDALPDPGVRPIERVKLGGRERRRASGTPDTPKATDWAWGEDAES